MNGQQIFIPPLGTVLQLTQDWHFTMQHEGRNERALEAAGLVVPFQDKSLNWREMDNDRRQAHVDTSPWEYDPDGIEPEYSYYLHSGIWTTPFVLRADTELRVRRIYIRQGLKGYDSVTFSTKQWVSAPGDPLFKAPRSVKTLQFWARLSDVNSMFARVLPSSTPAK